MAIPRILFVDDEAPILVGLERTLRWHRRELEMVFANGGEAALAALDAAPFDLVISDLRMPKVDGAALLAAVMERQPAAMRVVLSGQADRETALRSAAAAHRFIAKPSGPDDIRDVVAFAVALQGRLPDADLRVAVGRVGQLPILARVRAELLRALGRPETSLRDLARIALDDAGLCAKLLQLANAGFFGLTRRYSVVEDAVAALGGDLVRSLVASLPVREGEVAEEQQRRASAVAALAAVLVSDVALEAQAYTAGFLHNLGRRIVGPLAADEVARTAGAYLLEAWALPAAIVDAVAGRTPSELATAVAQAERLDQAHGDGRC